MKRIFLFLCTNFAILAVLSVSMRVLGVEQMLYDQGVGINLNALLVFALALGMGGSFISLAMSKWVAKRGTGARVIEQPANQVEAWLVQTVKAQAERAGIGMPEVAIYEAPEINAFATGMNKHDALVAVSTGLLANMTRDEAEAVLGHEVSHVANGDMVTLALIQGVLNTFVIFFSRILGMLIDRMMRGGDSRGGYFHGPGYWLGVIVAEVVLGILATIIVMWFSRYREFHADAGGAALAGRRKMIAALKRLQLNYGQPAQLPDQIAAFGISGGVGAGLKKLFMSHPPLQDRIRALESRED